MRENADQNNSKYGHFLRSICSASNWIIPNSSDKFLISLLSRNLDKVDR